MTRDEIKSTRKLQKLSQAALGKLTNLTASEISRIECGYRDLSEAEAAVIASALGHSKPAPVAPATPAAVGLAAATQMKVKEDNQSLPTSSAPTPKAPIGKPMPSGSDLSDPANFGVLPDLQLLSAVLTEERARLSAELARAQTILHTPRVPAAVWRAWRQFELQATERLRSSAAATVPVASPVVAPSIAPAKAVPASVAAVPESKSLNSLFVEAARELLPAETFQRLNHATERARAEDPSIGFMKHFRRIAEADLDAATVKRVTGVANQRLASPERWRARRGRQRSSDAAK